MRARDAVTAQWWIDHVRAALEEAGIDVESIEIEHTDDAGPRPRVVRRPQPTPTTPLFDDGGDNAS
jgi:glutathione S-transferase